MTRAEAEASIRAVARTCRGPLLEEHARRRDQLFAEGKPEEARAYEASHWGIPYETPEGTRFRKCNYDMNDLICAGPIDGRNHTPRCPGCGRVVSYRVAWFPDLPPEERAAPGEWQEVEA